MIYSLIINLGIKIENYLNLTHPNGKMMSLVIMKTTANKMNI